MLKKFGYSLVVAGALMVGVGVVNSAFVSAVQASEKACDKCKCAGGKAEKDCKCECHKHTH